MKKLILCVCLLAVLFSISTICYAGSIPEDLLFGEDAQVYFGEVKDIDGSSITVIQRQNIKGEFTQDSEITYEKSVFTDSPKIGKQYLCGYLNEGNPLYVWEVSGFDTKTLEIINVGDPDSMSGRMQAYLNDGKFEEKELERLSALNEPAVSHPPIPEETQMVENQSQSAEDQSLSAENQSQSAEDQSLSAENQSQSAENQSQSVEQKKRIGSPAFVLILCAILLLGTIIFCIKKVTKS